MQLKLGQTRDPNLYGYVLGDPVNFVDPLGMFLGLPSAEEVGTRFTGFIDGFTLGATDKIREKFGLQGGLDKCSLDYRFAHGMGRVTVAIEAGVISGGTAGFLAAEIGAGAAASALSVGAASGAGETFVYQGGTPSAKEMAVGTAFGMFGGVVGDLREAPTLSTRLPERQRLEQLPRTVPMARSTGLIRRKFAVVEHRKSKAKRGEKVESK